MSTILSSVINLDVTTPESLSPKTLHLLRVRLQDSLDETAGVVLEELGIINEDIHAIHVEEIEQEDLEEIGSGDD